MVHALKVKGFDVHCPLVRIEAGQVPALRFPGYLFVAFDRDDYAWRGIPTTRRVVRLFSVDAERPIPVRRGYVEGLIAEAGERGFVDAVGDEAGDLAVGATVRITDGPMQGFVGVVARSSRKIVEVMVTCFGRTAPAMMARGSVDRVAG